MDDVTKQVQSEEEMPAAPTTAQTETKRRSPWLFAGIALLVVVLAGAAYVGATLLSKPKPAAGGTGPMISINTKGSAGEGKSMVKLDMVPAAELPQSQPDVKGVLTRREDNSLFLGTGRVTMEIKQTKGATPESAVSYDGPVVEVVVTHDTQIWRDETEMGGLDKLSSGASGEKKVQQIVKPGSLDEIQPNSQINVWGEKRGDRTVARILSYRNN